MARKSASSSRINSAREGVSLAKCHARRGLALFLTWVLVFQAIYGANTTEAIAEGLQDLGQQIAQTQTQTQAQSAADADDAGAAETASEAVSRTQPVDWTSHTDALVLSSTGLAPSYGDTDVSGAVAAASPGSVTLPGRIAASLNLSIDLDASRDADATLAAGGLVAGDSFAVTLPGGVSAATADDVPVYAADDQGNATTEQVGVLRFQDGVATVTLLDALNGRTSSRCVAAMPVTLDSGALGQTASALVWTLQELSSGAVRTAELSLPARDDVARGLGLVVEGGAPAELDSSSGGQSEPASGVASVSVAPSSDRTAAASDFVTAWADNSSAERPSAAQLASRCEYRLYFQVEGDEARYPLTTDGRTVSVDAQRLLGLTQDELDEIRKSAPSSYGAEPELVSVVATATNEYTATSATGLPAAAVTTTVTPGIDENGNPTSTTTTEARKVTYCITHEVAGDHEESVTEGALLYETADGEPSYLVMAAGKLDADVVPFERECLAAVSRKSVNVVLNLGAGSESYGNLYDWLDATLSDGTRVRDHVHLGAWVGDEFYKGFAGDELDETMQLLRASLVESADSDANSYVLSLYAPLFTQDQGAVDLRLWQDEIENSNSDGYRDYYQVWYDNAGSITTGSDASASFGSGSMTVTRTGNTSFSATKVWLDDDPSARPATTYTLWRYSDKQGQSSLTAAQVQFDNGEFASVTMSAEQNAALGPMEYGGIGGDIPQNNVTVDLTALFKAQAEGAKLPKYDQDGYPYVYFVREDIEGSGYSQVMGSLDAEGNVEQGSDPGPNYWNGARTEHMDAQNSSTTRPTDDLPIYDGGTVSNVRTQVSPQTVTKTWDAAAYQDQLSDVVVTMKCQRILKRHAYETYPGSGVWMPNYDPMYDEDGNWVGTYEWTDFEAGPGETPTVQELTGWNAENMSQTLSGNYDKYDAHGEEYVYRWIEVNVDKGDGFGFFLPSDDYMDGMFFLDLTDESGNTDSVMFVSHNDPATGTITNRYANTTERHVDKLWAQVDDEGNVVTDADGNTQWTQDAKPYGDTHDVGTVSVRLIRDGELIGEFQMDGTPDDDATELKNPDGSAMMGDEVDFWSFGIYSTASTVQETSPWHLDFSSLPKFAPDGHRYSYQVIEGEKSGYWGDHSYDADSLTTTLRNTPGTGGEASIVRVSKRWLDGGNNTARPSVRVGVYAKHDMANAAGTVRYAAGDKVGEVALDATNEWLGQLSVPIGGLTNDDFTISELSTETEGTSLEDSVAVGETRVITKEQAQAQADAGNESYEMLLASWNNADDGSQRMLTSDYAYEVSYGKNDVLGSLEVTNRRVGLAHIDIYKSWADVGVDGADRPKADFRITNTEGEVTFSYDENGELLANVEGLDPLPVRGEGTVTGRDAVDQAFSVSRLNRDNTEVSDDGHTLLVHVDRLGGNHDAYTIQGLPKYNANGDVLRWGVSESWDGDSGDYVSSQTSYSEQFGGEASPWHHLDLMEWSFTNARSATKDVTFHTRWYDHYVKDTLDQRVDIYLTLYRRVHVYDADGNPEFDADGNPVYSVEPVEGYQHYNWAGEGETGQDALYSQYATVNGLAKYDEHGGEIVYYASVHHSQSDSTYANLDYADPWFTYGASADDPENAGYPGSSEWDEANASDSFKAESPNNVQVDGTVSGNAGYAVREDGTFNIGLAASVSIPGEKIWANLPSGFLREDLPSIEFFLQRRVAGGHYEADGSWASGGNDWGELSVSAGASKGDYSVLSYDSSGEADYAVADGTTAVAWTGNLAQVRGNRYSFTMSHYGSNDDDASDARALPKYDRNGRAYEYRVREIIDGLIRTSEDGSDVPGGFDVSDLEGGETPEEGANGVYTVHYGASESYRIRNIANDSAKGRLTVKKLFSGLQPGDLLPNCTFALYRYYVRPNGEASQAQLVETKTMSLEGERANAQGQFMRVMSFDDLDVYTPAGTYWVYFVAEQPINGYNTSVGTGDLVYGSADLRVPWTGADVLADGSVRTDNSAKVSQLEEGSALYAQPTDSVVSDDYSVDYTFQNSYFGQDDDFGELTGTKYWYDQHNAAGTRPEDIELVVTRRYANGQLDATDGGVVTLQGSDPDAANYVSWNKAAGSDGSADKWTYTISNLERIAPDGTYWRYEVREKAADGGDYLVSSGANGGTVDMSSYDGNALSVGRIDNYLKTKVGFTKTWVGDSSDAWRQRPVVYVTLQARVRETGGAWGAWAEAGSVYEQVFGLSLAHGAPFSDYSCPEGSVLPSGQNTVERIASDSTGNFSSDSVWQDLPSAYESAGQAYELDYRVVETRLVYDKKGEQVVVDVDAPGDDGVYGSVEGAYQPSQSEKSWTNGDTYKHSTITNALVDATSLTVTKTWDDEGNAWASRPGTASVGDTWSVTYVLQRRTNGGQWRWLTSYGTNLTSPFDASGNLDSRLRAVTVSGMGDSASATFDALPLHTKGGGTYEYRAVELVRGSYDVDGGEVLATSGASSLVVSSGAGASSAYTNELRTVSLSGTKSWNDWGAGIAAQLSPETCGIHLTLRRSTDDGATWEDALRADGSEASPTWSATADGIWAYTFDGLPETDQQGRAYTYRAIETDGSVPGFFSDKSASADGTAADGSIANVATRLTFDKVGDGTTGSAADGSLNGVRFVMSRDGQKVATWERGEDGVVTATVGGDVQAGAIAGYIVGLPAGTYTVHEDKTPAGYVAAADFTVTIGADGSVSTSAGGVVAADGTATVAPQRGNACVRVPNSVFRAQVSLEKYFSHGGAKVAVPGMTFDLYRVGENGVDALVATGITTDAQGTWSSAASDIAVETDATGTSVLGALYQRLSDGLPQGSYYLLETGASALTQQSSARYDFSVGADDHAKTVSVSAENDEFSASIHLAKVDGETGAAIDGAVFELFYTPEGSAVERSLGTLESGRGYVLDATCSRIESSSAADAGKLLVSGLKKGAYRLVEVSNEGYALPSDKPQVRWSVADEDQGADIDLADDERPWTDALTQDDALVNHPLHGNVTFQKLDEDAQGLNGAIFRLQVKQGDSWTDVAGGASLESGHAYAADVTSGGVSKLAATGALEAGRITVTNLPWGTYRLVEVEAVPGYVGKTAGGWPTSDEVTIDRSSVAGSAITPLDMGTLTNRKATINIKKVSWGDGSALAGAHFAVRVASGEPFLDGAAVKYLTTDASGIARADAPSAASDGNSNELAGAVEVGQSYVITETQAPAGYGTPDPSSFTVAVAEDGTLVAVGEASDAWRIDTSDGVSTLTVRDKAISLQFKKVDENGDPLVGAEFTLSGVFADGQGEKVVSPAGDGAVAFSPDGMLEGEVYTLHESQPPVGYATVADLQFQVAHAGDGEVCIKPVGEMPSGWTISDDGVTATAADEPVEFLIQKRAAGNEDVLLANAEFTITGLFVDDEGEVTRATYSGITNASGTIRSVDCIAAGTRVEVTGEDGSKTSEVADGVYEVSETGAPYGYELADSTLRVRIAADGSMSVVGDAAGGWSLDASAATVTLADDPIRLAFAKVANGSEQPLEGAEFSIAGVFAAEDGTLDNEGHTQYLSGLSVDELSQLRFVAGEGYRLSETKAPAGYELISGFVDFDVTEQGTITRFSSSAGNGSYGLSANRLTLTARDLPVELTITKSSEEGARLAGGSFSLAPTDGGAFADGSTAAITLVTDANGVARLDGASSGASLSAMLVAGNTYVLSEATPPAGYKRLSGEVRVAVAADGSVILEGQDAVANGSVALRGGDAISVTDEAVPFAIVKYGEAGEDGARPTLAGARFCVTPQAGSAFADGSTEGRKVTTGDDGRAGAELAGMLVVGGTYGIREVEAPAGYTRIDHELVVRVSDDGTLVAVFGGQDETAALRGYEVVGDELRVFTGAVTDDATSLTVMKRDADNPLVGLDGATFALAPVDGFTFADGSTDARQVTTAETGGVSGIASFDRALLRADATSVYELRETRAPDGYSLSGQSVLLRVGFDGSVVAVRPQADGYVEMGAEELASLGFALTDNISTLVATDKPVDVTLRKTGEDGAALAGATFTLTPADGTNDYGEPNRFASGSETDVLELTSTTEGLLLSRQLVVGNTYELEETAAPDGYAVCGGRVLLHVNEDGTVAVSPVDEGALVSAEVAANEPACAYKVGDDGVTVTLADPMTRLSITKVGSDGATGASMSGARFEVRGRFAGASEEGSLVLETGVDGRTPQLAGKLVAGERYVVREVVAPEGYELLGSEFTLWVREDGTIVSGGDAVGWSLCPSEDGVATLTATDDPTPVPPLPAAPDGPSSTRRQLPQTGDVLVRQLPALTAAAGLVLLAIGLRRRRRRA
mgnify:CR=1 FL=1